MGEQNGDLAGAADREATLPGDSVTPWEAGHCGGRQQGRTDGRAGRGA